PQGLKRIALFPSTRRPGWETLAVSARTKSRGENGRRTPDGRRTRPRGGSARRHGRSLARLAESRGSEGLRRRIFRARGAGGRGALRRARGRGAGEGRLVVP